MNGLLITDVAFDVFDIYGDKARYAGLTRDGRGIVFLDDVLFDPSGEMAQGTWYAEEPDYPDTWPDWARPSRGPKRKVADGTEAFIVLPAIDGGAGVLFAAGYDVFGQYQGPDGKVIIIETTRARLLPTPPLMETMLVIEEYQDRRLVPA